MKGKIKIPPVVVALLAVVFTALIIVNEGNPSIAKSGYPELKSRCDVIIPRLMKKHNVPGVAVAFVKKGEVDWVKGYGLADKGKGAPVTGDTEFQVASNSKTLAAWGVMKLVENGKLDLDAPVEQYLKRWHLPATQYDNNQVTIRRILSHTAGLSQGGYAGYPPDQKLSGLVDSLSGKVKGVQELKVVIKPGTKYKYSGGGYTLLQLIVEEVTGKPFAQYMEEEVLIPLGMKNSSYEWKPGIQAKTSGAYDVFGYAIPNYLYTETAAAGLYTTAGDLARFVAANMDGKNGASIGRGILTKDSLALMHKPGKKDYGLGYIIKKLPDGAKLIYHGGSNRGWRAQFAFLPKSGDGLVVLTNSENGENLHRDLVSLWVKWETGYWPDFHMKDTILRMVIKVLAFFIFLLLVLSICKTVKTTLNQKTLFVFMRKHTGAYSFSAKDRLLSAANCLLAVLLAVAWYIALYTGLLYNGWTFASFAPSGFIWVTTDVFLWSIFLFIKSWFISIDTIKNRQEAQNGF